MAQENCEHFWDILLPINSQFLKKQPFPKKKSIFKWDLIFKDNFKDPRNFILRLRAAPAGRVCIKYSAILKTFNKKSKNAFKTIFKGDFEFDNDDDLLVPDSTIIYEHTVIENYRQYFCASPSNCIAFLINISACCERLSSVSAQSLSSFSAENCQPCDESNHAKQLLDAVRDFPEFYDVEIVVDGVEIKAHKSILAAVSPVFRAILATNMKEKNSGRIKIKNFEVEIIRLMIDFIYIGHIELSNWHMASELLRAADIYDIQKLHCVCADYLLNKINAKNVMQILTVAEITNTNILKEAAINHLIHNPKPYKSSDFEEILQMRPSMLPELLERVFSAYTKCKYK